MEEKRDINFFSMDYRLNGFSVNRILQNIDKRITVFNEVLPTISLSKGAFYNFLKLFKREKDFARYAKGGTEKELYIPYIKIFLAELKENLHKRARIFETEEEDRMNKSHRRCILNILPYIRVFGSFYSYFYFRLESSGEFRKKNFKQDLDEKTDSSITRECKKGHLCTEYGNGWRNHKPK